MKFTIGILLRWIPDKWPWRRRYKWQYSPEWSRLFHLDCRWVQERWRHSSGEHTCKDKWRGSVTVTHPLLVNKKKKKCVSYDFRHTCSVVKPQNLLFLLVPNCRHPDLYQHNIHSYATSNQKKSYIWKKFTFQESHKTILSPFYFPNIGYISL